VTAKDQMSQILFRFKFIFSVDKGSGLFIFWCQHKIMERKYPSGPDYTAC